MQCISSSHRSTTNIQEWRMLQQLNIISDTLLQAKLSISLKTNLLTSVLGSQRKGNHTRRRLPNFITPTSSWQRVLGSRVGPWWKCHWHALTHNLFLVSAGEFHVRLPESNTSMMQNNSSLQACNSDQSDQQPESIHHPPTSCAYHGCF